MRLLSIFIIILVVSWFHPVEAESPINLTTEYQFKLKTKELKNRGLDYIYKQLESEFIGTKMKLVREDKPAKIFNKTDYFTTIKDLDRRTSIRSRCGDDKSDLTLKYTSASLSEILVFNFDDDLKLEQDVYDRYTKFSVTFEIPYDCAPLVNYGDIKELFPKNRIIVGADPSVKLYKKSMFVRRDKSFSISFGKTKLQLTFDFDFDNDLDALDANTRSLRSGEISFRTGSSSLKTTNLAILAFKVLEDFELIQSDYTIKEPRTYY